MTIYSKRTLTLPSGDRILIRSADAGDARRLLEYQRRILAESEYLLRTPDEFNRTLRQQRGLIRDAADRRDQVMLVAVSGHTIAGVLETAGSHIRRLSHGISFAVTVARNWRRRGVGTLLVRALLDWSHHHPTIERVELHVHSGNLAARHLYEKLGFVVEGHRRKAVKYEDGRYMDDIVMACLVKEDHQAGTGRGKTIIA